MNCMFYDIYVDTRVLGSISNSQGVGVGVWGVGGGVCALIQIMSLYSEIWLIIFPPFLCEYRLTSSNKLIMRIS